MIFIIFIAALFGLSFVLFALAGFKIGENIKDANLPEDERKQKTYHEYLEYFNETGWPDAVSLNKADAKSMAEMKWCGIWNLAVSNAKAIQDEYALEAEERQLELEERRIELAERKQRLQQAKGK